MKYSICFISLSLLIICLISPAIRAEDEATQVYTQFLRKKLHEKGFSKEFLDSCPPLKIEELIKYIERVKSVLEKSIHSSWDDPEFKPLHIVSHYRNRSRSLTGKEVSTAGIKELDKMDRLILAERSDLALKMVINHAAPREKLKLYVNLGSTNMEHLKFLAKLDQSDEKSPQ